jgi:hypothetical protein
LVGIYLIPACGPSRRACQPTKCETHQAQPYVIYADLLVALGEHLGQESGALGSLTQHIEELKVELGGVLA